MKTLKLTLPLIVSLFAIAALLVLFVFATKAPIVQGSTSRGSEYQGTTTTQGSWSGDAVVLTSPGTLGSIVITGANTGTINVYDATTSNINLRTGNTSSSSILVATIPASAAANTYTFDRLVFNGLLINIVGLIPTSTITFRQ